MNRTDVEALAEAMRPHLEALGAIVQDAGRHYLHVRITPGDRRLVVGPTSLGGVLVESLAADGAPDPSPLVVVVAAGVPPQVTP